MSWSDARKVVCNSNSHNGLTHKVRPSTREENSIEWLLYAGLAREFANDPRVEFVLPHGVMTYVKVYDFMLRFTHGDSCRGGDGVGGIMIPIMKKIAKWDARHPGQSGVTALGHFRTNTTAYCVLDDQFLMLIGFDAEGTRSRSRREPGGSCQAFSPDRQEARQVDEAVAYGPEDSKRLARGNDHVSSSRKRNGKIRPCHVARLVALNVTRCGKRCEGWIVDQGLATCPKCLKAINAN